MVTQTFENALKRLEKIVEELESGELPLEKSLKKFEEGIEITKYCSKKLDETEARVTQLVKTGDGNLVETPFSDADEAEKENDTE